MTERELDHHDQFVKLFEMNSLPVSYCSVRFCAKIPANLMIPGIFGAARLPKKYVGANSFRLKWITINLWQSAICRYFPPKQLKTKEA